MRILILGKISFGCGRLLSRSLISALFLFCQNIMDDDPDGDGKITFTEFMSIMGK